MAKDHQRAVAYHEIGHAIAALMCGEKVMAVHVASAGPAEFQDVHGRDPLGCCGLCETGLRPFRTAIARSRLEESPKRWWPVIWARALNHAFFCGAGLMAEAKSQGIPLTRIGLTHAEGWRSDLDRAMAGFEAFEADPEEREDMVWSLWEQSAALIAKPTTWQTICILAQKATPRGAEIVRLSGDAIEERARAYISGLPDAPLTTVIPTLAGVSSRL
jgi:hypothetical protein